MNRGHHLSEYHALLGPYIFFNFFYLGVKRLFAFFAACSPPHKPLGFNDDTFVTVGQLKRIILNIFAGPAEYRMKQFFFRRKLGLAFRHNLAHQNIARLNPRAFLNHAVLVKITQRLFAYVWYVVGEFFLTQRRLAYLGVKFIDMNTCEAVIPD